MLSYDQALKDLQSYADEIERLRAVLSDLRHAFSNAGQPGSDISDGPFAQHVIMEIDGALRGHSAVTEHDSLRAPN